MITRGSGRVMGAAYGRTRSGFSRIAVSGFLERIERIVGGRNSFNPFP